MVMLPMTLGDPEPTNHPNFNILHFISYLHNGLTSQLLVHFITILKRTKLEAKSAQMLETQQQCELIFY